MENYHYLQAKAPYSLDSLLPLEITDDMYAMNMAFVERYGINNLPEEWKNSQGIYILFSHLKPGYRFEAYVGQTLSGFHQRLVRHDKERSFWDTAILARRTTADGFNSLQLNALEGKLRDILDASPNVHVHNGYPTGDKTMQAGDANLVDKITLSIMRVMFMRGYRNQHMGAEADRLQDAISGVQATVQPSVATSMHQPVSNAPTGFVGAMGKLFGLTPATTPVTPVVTDPVPSVSVTPEVNIVATESIDARGLNLAQALKFEELRVWRKEQAAVEGKSGYSYAVLPDKTLINLCMASPQTPADLLRVSGIGQDKAGKYGEAILGVMGG